MKATERTVALHKSSLQDSFGIYIGEEVPYGIYVITIDADSPAAEANIHAGDRILAVNGYFVSSMSKNAKEIISKIASTTHNLTLIIQPTAIYEFLNVPLTNSGESITHYAYVQKDHNNIDSDLEKYSIFSF